MKPKLGLLFPERWGKRNLLLRAVVFSLVTFVLFYAGDQTKLGGDEIFLVAMLSGLMIAYWVPPYPGRSWLTWVMTHIPLLMGVYLFALKIPRLLTSWINYRLASLILLLVFGAGWLLFYWREKRSEEV